MVAAAGAGILRFNKAVDDASKKLDDAAAKAERAQKAFADFAASIGGVENAVNNATNSLKEIDQVSGDVAVGFGAILDITKALADYGRRGDATSSKAEQNKAADQLQALESKLQALTGGDSRFAGNIDNVVQQLRAGLLSPTEAVQVLQALIGPFSETLMREAIDPSQSPAMRKMAEELEQFILSGNLNALLSL